MHAIVHVLKGIILKAVLDAVISKDLPVYLAHLLCLFFIMHALNIATEGNSTKYIFAAQIVQVLDRDFFVGIAFCVALQVNIKMLSSLPRLQVLDISCWSSLLLLNPCLQECAQMIAIQLVVQWFQDSIPNGFEFTTTLLFMHMASPFVDTDKPMLFLTDLYAVALYKISGTIQLPGSDRFVQTVYAGLLWRVARDKVSILVGQFCCVQTAAQIVLDAGTFILRTDPILATWFIMCGLAVILSLASQNRNL